MASESIAEGLIVKYPDYVAARSLRSPHNNYTEEAGLVAILTKHILRPPPPFPSLPHNI